MDQSKPEKAAASTTIGHTIVIRGKLKSNEDLIVHGRIDAEITSAKSVLIESAGIVKAAVRAESLSVSGILIGNAQADTRMEISSGGRMVGDILSPEIVISDGAAFRGQIDMQGFDQPRVSVGESLRADPAPEPYRAEPQAPTRRNGISAPPVPEFSPGVEPAAVAAAESPAVADMDPSFGSGALDAAVSPEPASAQEPAKPTEASEVAVEADTYAVLGLTHKGRKKKGMF